MRKKSVSTFTLTLLFLVGVVFTLPVSISAQPSSLQTSIIPENVQWVVHLDMKKFTSTRLFDLLIQDKKNRIEEKSLKFAEKFKFNPLKDIMGITVFGFGRGEKNTVLCLRGNFNKDHLLSLLKMNEENKEFSYGTYTIYHWDHAQYGAFADEHLVVVANDEDVIKNVLDVFSGKKKNFSTSNLMLQLKGVPENAFFRAVVDNISHLAGHHGDESAILKKTGMAFFIALESNQNLTIKLKLTTNSPETAANVQQIVQGFIALAKLKQKEEEKDPRFSRLLKLIDNLKIKLEGNTLYMELTHPSKEIVDLLSHGRKTFDILD
jgi:hypothetical protein